MTRWKRYACVVMAVGVPLVGCSPEQSASPAPDAGALGSDPGNNPPPSGAALMLPVTVSDYFVPGGYMGDGEISSSAIAVEATTCRQPRPPGASGDCYRFRYTPGAKAWAGVYWQYPEKNWGANPGERLEAGATKVTFYAAGATGHESIQFIAGGENDLHLPYHDSFTAMTTVTLTTTLTQYQIDLTGRTYDPGVLGAFAWSVGVPPGSVTPVEFYLDTIRWEK